MIKRKNLSLFIFFSIFINVFLCDESIAEQPHIQRSGANLVTNSDFDGISAWGLSGDATYDSSVSRDIGTGSIKLTTPYPETNYSYLLAAYADRITVTPGKTYTLACYMRSDAFPCPLLELYVAYYNSSNQYIRNAEFVRQSVSAVDSWQECVNDFIRPQAGDAYVQIKALIVAPSGANVWIDNIYFGENVGFEQAPTAKIPFNGSITKVDALGNVEVYKNGEWICFFPIGIYSDNDLNRDWSDYSAQGFNTIVRAWDYLAVQRAQDAGMMANFEITPYIIPGHAYYNDLNLLESRINGIKTNGLMNNVLAYYWDNEQYSEWTVPAAVTGKVRDLDLDVNQNLMHPIYIVQGNDGLARRYKNSLVNMTDIVMTYVGGTAINAMDRLLRLDNLEDQQNPLGTAIISHGIGTIFRPRLFNAIAHGAKSVAFFRDDYDGTDGYPPVENQPWWDDLPNIVSEIEQMLPVIRMPHWTDWSLSANNSLIDFGTRDYQGQGYIIVTNEQDSAQSVTFTISNLPYTAIAVKNFFTHEIEANVVSSQFTISIPSYGSKVYVLENNIEETLILKLLCSEASGSTTCDESYFINDGTLNGNAALGSGVVTLDGSGDYVNCGNDSSLELGTNDMSIIAHVKLNQTQGTYAGIVTKGAGSPSDAGYALFYYNGSLVFPVSSGSTRLWLNSNGSLGLNDGEWHTVGVSLNRDGNAEFYVDGSSVGSASASSLSSADIVNSSNNLLVGSWIGSHFLNGQVDSVRVYKKALSATEMADLSVNMPLDMQFSEVFGNPCDSSVCGNDGTLAENATVEDGVLTLDGSGDYVDCGNDSSLELGTGDISIIARVNLAPTQSTYAGIVTKGAGSPSEMGYTLFYYNGALVFPISNGSTRLWLSSNGSLGLNNGEWHTVGVSLDRDGNAEFYVDGNSVGSANASSLSSADIVNYGRNLLIGSWIGGNFLNGQIDSAHIYKRALSATEMENLTMH